MLVLLVSRPGLFVFPLNRPAHRVPNCRHSNGVFESILAIWVSFSSCIRNKQRKTLNESYTTVPNLWQFVSKEIIYFDILACICRYAIVTAPRAWACACTHTHTHKYCSNEIWAYAKWIEISQCNLYINGNNEIETVAMLVVVVMARARVCVCVVYAHACKRVLSRIKKCVTMGIEYRTIFVKMCKIKCIVYRHITADHSQLLFHIVRAFC